MCHCKHTIASVLKLYTLSYRHYFLLLFTQKYSWIYIETSGFNGNFQSTKTLHIFKTKSVQSVQANLFLLAKITLNKN